MKKSARRECFCALCRTPRTLRYERKMQSRHFIQILVLTLSLGAALYPWIQWKGFMSLPIVWAIFESVRASLYRKELKCPFCGFDPSWYKKDVKIARQKVEEFLKQNPESALLRRNARMEEMIKSSLN